MNRRGASLVRLAALGVGVATAFAAYNLMKNLHSSAPALDALHAIGKVQINEGKVEARLPKTDHNVDVHAPMPFYNQEQIFTRGGAKATLSFSNGSAITLAPDTKLVAETEGGSTDSVTVTVLTGLVSVTSPGPDGKLRIRKDGEEISVQELLGRSLKELTSSPNSPFRQPARLTVVSGNDQTKPARSTKPLIIISATTLPDDTASARGDERSRSGKGESGNETATRVLGEALTDAEISRQIRGQSSFFQRCYLSYISRSQEPSSDKTPGGAPHPGAGFGLAGGPVGQQSGDVVLSFKIQPTGKVGDAKVSKSDLNNPTLLKCLTEVLERTSFRAFNGEAITIEEFPISLQ